MRRVVVTGMGMVSPLGASVEESWRGIVAGRSAATTIEKFDASAIRPRVVEMYESIASSRA